MLSVILWLNIKIKDSEDIDYISKHAFYYGSSFLSTVLLMSDISQLTGPCVFVINFFGIV